MQKYVLEEFRKEISVELGIVTRWNSLVPMIEKFVKLQKCIKKAIAYIHRKKPKPVLIKKFVVSINFFTDFPPIKKFVLLSNNIN